MNTLSDDQIEEYEEIQSQLAFVTSGLDIVYDNIENYSRKEVKEELEDKIGELQFAITLMEALADHL